ncbi:MAG: Lrp/AsnC family transcriptional regulator [Gemmatimonadetes bacterium]|nr:Lrp/AsnC family transcriptional regulator [Gemmatimonadota bacterium]
MYDPVDLLLLEMLQENGRVSQHDLARAVGLSAPAVAERLRKLEERGVIVGYTAVLDPRQLGLPITTFISVRVTGSRHFGGFRARVEEQDEIVECHAVTGDASHLLKARLESVEKLERLLAFIQSWPGVEWTRTSMALSALKERGAIPLPASIAEGTSGSAGEMESAPQLLHVPFRHHS